jgi:hypothetical protein
MGWLAPCVTTIQPVSYLDMLLLEGLARFILTDSRWSEEGSVRKCESETAGE